MQPLFAYNALIWKNTITILTLILFVVFLVRGPYLFAVLGKHLLKAIKVFNINNKQGTSEALSGSRGQHPRQAKAQEIHSVLSNVTSISYIERHDPANQVPANGGACSRNFQGYVPKRKR